MSFIFNPSEDPRQREARKNKAVMEALQAGAQQPPQDMGQGIASLGHALAYRSMQGQQEAAASDPWAGMRQPTAGMFGARAALPWPFRR